MKKNSYITVTDQFCGAGGSSQGVRMVAQEQNLGTGLEVKLAMNHWKLAIETHNTNFPETDHVCTDISACDPRRYHSTSILITSPECTVHSPAGGGMAKKRAFGNQIAISGKLASEEAEERSRATMWDVCRFAEYHNYEIIIVENVIEARKWVLFDTWLTALLNLGYNHEIKYINSMHAHPTPQSRDRMYCVFWKKTNPKPDLNFNPVAHCTKCLKNVEAYQWWKPGRKVSITEHGKYKTQYLFKCPGCHDVVEPYYYASFNCIDWSRPGTIIGDRLSKKTRLRCQFGIDKYWSDPTEDALKPCIISSRYISGIGNRVKTSKGPLPVQVTEARESVMFAPLVMNGEYGKENKIRPATEQNFTQTTRAASAIVTPPLLIGTRYGAEARGVEKTVFNPMRTQTTMEDQALVTYPLIDEQYGQSKPRPATNPLGTIPTIQTHAIITDEKFNSFISYYYGGSNVASHITEATRTFSTKERALLIREPHKKPKLEDCCYRMLLPHEIQIGMAFDPDYIVLGDSKQKVKQLGNAVTPPVMKFLVERCIETLKK